MQIDAFNGFRLALCIFLGLAMFACRQEQQKCVFEGLSGARLTLVEVVSDDKPLNKIECNIYGKDGNAIAKRVSLGIGSIASCNQVGLYQASEGRYLGLYSLKQPDSAIVLLDLESRRILRMRAEAERLEWTKILDQLSHENKINLKLGGLYNFTQDEFVFGSPAQ